MTDNKSFNFIFDLPQNTKNERIFYDPSLAGARRNASNKKAIYYYSTQHSRVQIRIKTSANMTRYFTLLTARLKRKTDS